MNKLFLMAVAVVMVGCCTQKKPPEQAVTEPKFGDASAAPTINPTGGFPVKLP